jgi:hypothetical protein
MKMQVFSLTNKVALHVAVILFVGGVIFFYLPHTQANSDPPAGNGTAENNAAVTPSALAGSVPTDVATRDAQRISDLKQIQRDLELYFNECAYYPGMAHATSPCGKFVPNNTWAGLSSALIGSTPIGVTSIPNDPTTGVNYFYSAAVHGIGYALGATLEDPTNPALTQSVHGLVNGVNCDSPMYCVQL